MTTIYAVPEGFEPPDFMDFFDENHRYDREADDKAHADYFKRFAAHLRTEAKGDIVGEVLYFPHCDGSAAYMVASEKPFSLVHLPIHDAYRLPAAHERGLRLSDARSMVESYRASAARVKSEDAWWDSLEPGTILHYHNGFGEYVRCEVVVQAWNSVSAHHDAAPCLQPIALVGNWDKFHAPYHAKKVHDRTGAWRPSTGCVYEHPDFCPPRGENASIVPTDLEPLDITPWLR